MAKFRYIAELILKIKDFSVIRFSASVASYKHAWWIGTLHSHGMNTAGLEGDGGSRSGHGFSTILKTM